MEEKWETKHEPENESEKKTETENCSCLTQGAHNILIIKINYIEKEKI